MSTITTEDGAAKMIRGALLKEYPSGDHGIWVMRKDEVNADLLAFCRP